MFILLLLYLPYFDFIVVHATEQPPHFFAVKSRHLSQFMHVGRMNGKADVNQIFFNLLPEY